MRTRSYGELGLAAAVVFLLGWMSGSTLAPPVATTAGRIAEQPRTPARTIEVPRLALTHVARRAPVPKPSRNPFTFAGDVERNVTADADARRVEDVAAAAIVPAVDAGSTPTEAVESVPPSPVWKMVGVASAGEGTWTGIVSGAGDVHLVGQGGSLPGGWVVEAVDATSMRLVAPDGAALQLTLPS